MSLVSCLMKGESAHRNKEIEIRAQIEWDEELLVFLQKNATFEGEKEQSDEYFVPAHRDFLAANPINEWLRLRSSSGKASIAYKNWHREADGKALYCDELETLVGDLGQMKKIFEVLDMKSIVLVEKTRKIWRWKDWEFAIDKVKGLGDFVEIEFKGDADLVDPKEVVGEMLQFLKERNCGRVLCNSVGYPYQLLFPGKAVAEEV